MTHADQLDVDQTGPPARPPWITGRHAVWLSLRALPAEPAELRSLAAGIERLGFSALWLGGSWGEDLSIPGELLAGSGDLVVGTSVANIWRDPPELLAAAYAGLASTYGHRFVLGLGPGHASQVDLHQNNYARPVAALSEYLDGLDAAPSPVPIGQRALAALGPKALALAADRSAGALPLLTTPEHTRQARELLGPRPVLAPAQKLVLADDPAEARGRARAELSYYLGLANYVNAWRRLGFAESDVESGGSDVLVDALFGWGSPEVAVARVREHLAAGADQVCVQPIPRPGRSPLDDLQLIAELLD